MGKAADSRRWASNVGEIGVVIDHGAPEFFLELPVNTWLPDLWYALRVVADMGYSPIDFREYEPNVDANGRARIELERT